MARKTCVICGKSITENFYVCLTCVKAYDISYKYRDWPRWLKDLVNMEIKNLAILRIEEKHVSFAVPPREGFADADEECDGFCSPHKDIIKIF